MNTYFSLGIEQFDLNGKRALIVGGADGIGLAIARGYVACNAEVILADNNVTLLQERRIAFESLGHHVLTCEVDLASQESIVQLASFVAQRGGIDILVNSAAITQREAVLAMSDEMWDNIITVNLRGAHALAKAFGSLMIEQGRGGRMIFITSTGAYRASENYGAYSVSKAGVVMLCKTLALELAPHQILVNSIAPTATETKFTEEYYNSYPERREAAQKNHPLGRIAQPEDYVGTAIYLASAASAFVTGTLLVVDGGKTAK